MKKLITHNGSFHTDEIFSAATLSLLLKQEKKDFEIIRTRDEEIIKNGDYVFDVGGIYDPEQNKFDHHQVGGSGQRQNGIAYSSFGLVWKKFGIKLCNSQKVFDLLDKKLVAPIDADDNGFSLTQNKHDISPYLIQDIFSIMQPTWKEELNVDEMFFKCVNIAKTILSREIIHAEDIILAEETIVSIYNKAQDKRIIVLDKRYPYEYIFDNYPEIMFVIYPRKITNDWGARAVRKNLKTFQNRKDFPKSWGGQRDRELAELSGVPDAIFCHLGLFLAVAKSKEGAIKLAQIAVES